MANLVELYDLVIQAQSFNGVPLSHGHVYVYALGRTKLMDTWSDIDGESLNTNPVILDNAGQAHIYVSDDFDYTLVFTDEYDNEVFSVDKYLLSKGEHSHADVAVAPSEHIGVSSYHVGEVTVYVPYLTGEVGKTYEGIDPIVVNNTLNRISANHIPLGVQDPLYFVEDSETACIIGFSGEIVLEGVMTESALEFENNKITGYNGSAFLAAGNEYEAGNYISIDNNTINVVNLPTSADVQNIVDVATSGLMPSGDYLTKESADTLYAPTGNYLTGLPEDLVYTADITGLATTAQLDEKLDKSDSANFLLTSDSGNFLLTSDSGKFYPMDSNPSGYINELPSDLATTGWVDSQGYLTAVEIPESATWNATTQTVSANSAQWAGGTANPQIPVTSTSGISIFESGDKVYFNISANYATEDWVTAQGYLTAHQDLSDYQTTAGMTAYQPAGNYLTAVPDTYLQNTDLSTTDGKVTAISGIPLSAGGDVPEGVMVESAVEYNAVNEISGYNGSAIAQYGAEKQWLVHDDTLVHLSNSAQYALGVNLSAVAQLLGVDETVLYSNFIGRPTTVGSYIDLSESPLNFTEIAIYLNGSGPTANNIANGYERVSIEQLSSTNSLEFHKEFVGTVAGATSTVHDMGCGYSGTSGTRWTKWYGYSYNVANKTTDFNNNTHLNIWQVIGIGRKA